MANSDQEDKNISILESPQDIANFFRQWQKSRETLTAPPVPAGKNKEEWLKEWHERNSLENQASLKSRMEMFDKTASGTSFDMLEKDIAEDVKKERFEQGEREFFQVRLTGQNKGNNARNDTHLEFFWNENNFTSARVKGGQGNKQQYEDHLVLMVQMLAQAIKNSGGKMTVEIFPANPEAKKIIEQACEDNGLTIYDPQKDPEKDKDKKNEASQTKVKVEDKNKAGDEANKNPATPNPKANPKVTAPGLRKTS